MILVAVGVFGGLYVAFVALLYVSLRAHRKGTPCALCALQGKRNA